MGSGPPVFVEKLTWDNAYEIMLCRLESTLQMEWAVHVTMITWKPQASPAWQRWRRGAVGWWVCCVESSDILFLVSSLCLYFSLYCLYSSTHIYGKPLTCWPPSRVPQATVTDVRLAMTYTKTEEGYIPLMFGKPSYKRLCLKWTERKVGTCSATQGGQSFEQGNRL